MFIPVYQNSVILNALQSHNIKPMSSIFDLHIGISTKKYNAAELQLYSHITSFRRGICIADNIDITLPNSLLINFDNETYRIFVNDSDLCCHLCSNLGHSAAQCTEKLDDNFFVISVLMEPTTFEIEPAADATPLLTQKRPLSQSDSQTSTQKTDVSENLKSNQPHTPTQNKTKKSKKLKKTNNLQRQHLPQPPAKEMITPIQNNIGKQFANGNYPLNASNFAVLMDAVRKKTNTDEVKFKISQFQDLDLNLERLFKLLTKNYNCLTHRSMKVRFTKLCKHLLSIQPSLSNNITEIVPESEFGNSDLFAETS
ncbi:hypothetical protein PGB90_010674 [Kerria lacca]